VALYSVPMKILEVFMVVWTFFLNSMLTLFTKSFKDKNYEKLSELVGKSFKILFSMWVCFLTFWALFRDSIITIVANENYIKWLWHTYTSSDAFLIVLFVMLFYFISSIYNYLLIATENQRKLLNINIFITLFNILWNVIAIPVFSFVWAWIVTVISQILLFILTRREFNKIHKISLPLLYIFKVLLTWISIFILWSYILNNYHINLYFDLFITGGLLFMLYIWFIYKFYIIK
jgi:O-antigen/teichoic acid export membrane protein